MGSREELKVLIDQLPEARLEPVRMMLEHQVHPRPPRPELDRIRRRGENIRDWLSSVSARRADPERSAALEAPYSAMCMTVFPLAAMAPTETETPSSTRPCNPSRAGRSRLCNACQFLQTARS